MAAIKNDIAAGRLKKGQKIPAEPELMELYQVGRSTIREAIKTLAISGILNVQQGSGTFVTSRIKDETLNQRLRRADFEEINAVRSLLEKELVKLACSNRSDTDLLLMEGFLMKRRAALEAQDNKKATDMDIGFHIAIAKASGNTVLADLYESFTKVMRDFFSKREERNITHFLGTQPAHEALAKAIGNRDQQLAEQLTENILNNNY